MKTLRANIIGTGLIGTSIGLALKKSATKNRDWDIFGTDPNHTNLKYAMRMNAVDTAGIAGDAEISFVATPPAELPAAIKSVLEESEGVVTDVGSVKAPIVQNISDARFVGGHPMTGNELGILGASAELFERAIWVLTPTDKTPDTTYSKVCEVVKSLGAEVINLSAEEHDRLVAVVSHIPHLTAGALMRQAITNSQENRVLMRLAAGGFRDMTRIASGEPNIWLDICDENRDAISKQLSALIAELKQVKKIVQKGERQKLLEQLTAARQARISLPVGGAKPEDLVELRVPILDKPGSVAEVTTLATQLNTNIYDLEIAHFTEGGAGTMILVIEAVAEVAFSKKLSEAGYIPSSKRLL